MKIDPDSMSVGTTGAEMPDQPVMPSGPWTFGGQRFALSVGAKGLIVFVVLVVYLGGVALFAVHQKNLLLRDFQAIESALQGESILAQAHASIFHAIGAISVNTSAPAKEAWLLRIQMHQQLFLAQLSAVTKQFPSSAISAAHVLAAFKSTREDPSPANLHRLIAALIDAEIDLEKLTEEVRKGRTSLSERYRTQSDTVARNVLSLGMLGMLLLGATIGLFFRRLAGDLRILQRAALDTVRGVRGRPMRVTRTDEVGQLMVTVNSLADTLDKNQKELLLERQKYFHQEKMAAIGVLAAGISHEIGNPIAAISGLALEMIDRRTGATGCGEEPCSGCQPELIYEHTSRLATITREISEFASPYASEPQLIDLNEQLRSTARLIRYDRRLSNVSLVLNLDGQLPAVYGVSDQVTQVIMNLLINAMDALEGVVGRIPTITITTSAEPERACMAISDNGSGIAPEVLNRVCEAFFTTKPPGKGTGLGLSLCYSIVKAHNGSIEIQSTQGAGTEVKVYFPFNHSTQSGTCQI